MQGSTHPALFLTLKTAEQSQTAASEAASCPQAQVLNTLQKDTPRQPGQLLQHDLAKLAHQPVRTKQALPTGRAFFFSVCAAAA